MKDAIHQLHHTQKKVIQENRRNTLRQELKEATLSKNESQSNGLNGEDVNIIQHVDSPTIKEKKNSRDYRGPRVLPYGHLYIGH